MPVGAHLCVRPDDRMPAQPGRTHRFAPTAFPSPAGGAFPYPLCLATLDISPTGFTNAFLFRVGEALGPPAGGRACGRVMAPAPTGRYSPEPVEHVGAAALGGPGTRFPFVPVGVLGHAGGLVWSCGRLIAAPTVRNTANVGCNRPGTFPEPRRPKFFTRPGPRGPDKIASATQIFRAGRATSGKRRVPP